MLSPLTNTSRYPAVQSQVPALETLHDFVKDLFAPIGDVEFVG